MCGADGCCEAVHQLEELRLTWERDTVCWVLLMLLLLLLVDASQCGVGGCCSRCHVAGISHAVLIDFGLRALTYYRSKVQNISKNLKKNASTLQGSSCGCTPT